MSDNIINTKIRDLANANKKNLTKQEAVLWTHLKNKQLGIIFRRQYPIKNKYIVDFVCLNKKLIIELDGSQHVDNKKDMERTAFLENLGFRVIRFWNRDVNKNVAGVVEEIKKYL